MERQQLLTKGQIFKHRVLTGLEGANRPAENVPEPRDHGENINETSPTELIPKPMILRMYGVLMTHTIFIIFFTVSGCHQLTADKACLRR